MRRRGQEVWSSKFIICEDSSVFSRCCDGPGHRARSELWDQGRLKWGFKGLSLTGGMELSQLTKSIRHSPGFLPQSQSRAEEENSGRV